MKPEISTLILGGLAIGAGLLVLFLDWLERRKSRVHS